MCLCVFVRKREIGGEEKDRTWVVRKKEEVCVCMCVCACVCSCVRVCARSYAAYPCVSESISISRACPDVVTRLRV